MMHPEIAFAKVASTDALVKLLRDISAERFVSHLCKKIEAVGLTNHQDEFLRNIIQAAALEEAEKNHGSYEEKGDLS